MAVAAGVVIVAITNSSQDDLEEQSPDLESRCTGTEIYDPELAAAGVKGEVVGNLRAPGMEHIVEASAVGCIPVCILKNGAELGKIELDEIEFEREFSSQSSFFAVLPDGNVGNVVFSNPTTLVGWDHGSKMEYTVTPNYFHSSLTDAAEVRVGPGQDECHIYNSSGEIIG